LQPLVCRPRRRCSPTQEIPARWLLQHWLQAQDFELPVHLVENDWTEPVDGRLNLRAVFGNPSCRRHGREVFAGRGAPGRYPVFSQTICIGLCPQERDCGEHVLNCGGKCRFATAAIVDACDRTALTNADWITCRALPDRLFPDLNPPP